MHNTASYGPIQLSNLPTGNIGLRLGAMDSVELVQHWLGQALLAENVRLEPPGQVLANLVLHVGAGGNGEDVVQLFESTLFRLGQPQEAKND